jgi:hypothetical protein
VLGAGVTSGGASVTSGSLSVGLIVGNPSPGLGVVKAGVGGRVE